MSRRLAVILLASPALAASGAEEAETIMKEHQPTRLRPARDGNIAVREELDEARRAGTLEAYDLFLARHSQHPLAAAARRERARLRPGP